MLTARDEDVDKIIDLEVGADDYLMKPFNLRELVARVKSILRRATPERRQVESAQLKHGELKIDARAAESTWASRRSSSRRRNSTCCGSCSTTKARCSRGTSCRARGATLAYDTRTVDVHVRQLRRKLGDASPDRHGLGRGYKVSPTRDAGKRPPLKRRVSVTPLSTSASFFLAGIAFAHDRDRGRASLFQDYARGACSASYREAVGISQSFLSEIARGARFQHRGPSSSRPGPDLLHRHRLVPR